MDIEKTIQFLLEQQARFDSRQAEFDSRQAEFLARQATFEEDILQINDVLLRVATTQENTNLILATLTERHVALASSHQELSEAQKITEEKLHTLISTLERHLASHN